MIDVSTALFWFGVFSAIFWLVFRSFCDGWALVFSVVLFGSIFYFINPSFAIPDGQNGLETIYRIFVILIGVFGFPLLIRRIDMTQRQIFLSECHHSRSMLWSDSLPQRMDGIEGLIAVAKTYSQKKEVEYIFIVFVRNSSSYQEGDRLVHQEERKDIQRINEWLIGLKKSLWGISLSKRGHDE